MFPGLGGAGLSLLYPGIKTTGATGAAAGPGAEGRPTAMAPGAGRAGRGCSGILSGSGSLTEVLKGGEGGASMSVEGTCRRRH